MEQPAKNIAESAGQTLPTLRSEEIEGMLQEAQVIAETIAESVGLAEEACVEGDEASPGLGVAEPDAEAAVELVRQDVSRLAETLEQDVVDSSEAEAVEVEGAVETADEPQVSDCVDAVGEAEPDSTPATAAEAEGMEVDGSCETTHEEVHDMASNPPEDIHEDAVPETATSTSDATVTQAETPVRVSLRGRWATIRSWLGRVPGATISACGWMVRLTDLPFSWLSPGAKNMLGVIGLISLVMGAGAMLLPKVLVRNPYASMPPFPKAEASSEDAGHGTAAAKTESSGGHGAGGHH